MNRKNIGQYILVALSFYEEKNNSEHIGNHISTLWQPSTNPKHIATCQIHPEHISNHTTKPLANNW